MKNVSPRGFMRPLIASALALGLVAASAGVAVGGSRPARQDTALSSVSNAPARGPRYVAGEVLVHFRKGRAPSSARAIGARSIRSLSVAGWKLLRLRGGESVDHAVARLRSDARVDGVTPNHIYTSFGVPSDTLFPVQWGLQNTGQTVQGVSGTSGADISATSAWDVTTGSSSIIVAVADSGVNSVHPDLAPNVIAGQNFVPDRPSTSTYDAFGHGSHVAGIIGAHGNDEYGVTGVAQRVSIMPIRVLDDSGGGETSQIAEGFQWAAAHGAKVVNGSFGGPDDDPVVKASIQGNPNTLFVVAAGNASSNNDNVPDFPCNDSSPNLICVAASDQNDNLASFSNFGAGHVHLAAPGVNIASTYKPDPAGYLDTGYALSDSPAGGYTDHADNWAQYNATLNPSGATNCKLNYRLRAALAPNDIFTAETAPQSDPNNWTAVDTAGGGAGFTTTGNYVSRSVNVAGDGAPFRFRFHLNADAQQVSDGVYVDNVGVMCGSTTLLASVQFTTSMDGFITGGTPNTWGRTSIAYTWVYMNGTSMASPMVAGAASLLFAAHPTTSVAAVKAALLQGVDPLPAFATTTFSGGRLNIDKALQVIDATPPTGVALTGTGIASPYQLASSFGLGWTATDPGSGVKSFDVRYERAPYNGGFGPWTTWKSGVTTAGATFGSAPGYSFCLEVRARDNFGNVSGWTAPRCTDFPVNDTQLSAGAGWSRIKSSTRYLGDDTYTASKGATLTLANAQWRRMDLVVSVCNGCGSVAVFSGKTLLGTFSTNSPSFGTRHLVLVQASGHVNGPATITIRVTSPSGHAVMIEGLGLFRY